MKHGMEQAGPKRHLTLVPGVDAGTSSGNRLGLPWPVEAPNDHPGVGRHRAPETEALPSRVEDAMAGFEEEQLGLEMDWAEKNVESLYRIWLGDKGEELDRRFPHSGIREAAKNRLELLGEDVESIEHAAQEPVRIVGQVAVRGGDRHPALTGDVLSLPVYQKNHR